ncbi:signal peptidase II [bacterium]|nr:signal peptidase II [bacterium]
MKLVWRHAWYLLFISLPVIVLDQVTKLWAIASLKEQSPVVVFSSWWQFIYAENRGALFGIGNSLSETMRIVVFVLFSSLVTLGVVYMMLQKDTNKMLVAIYALIIGGAIGNLIDRIAYGYVVDFIDWHINHGYHWATFNVADAAIVVAMGLLIIEIIRQMIQERKA